ncbi:MAG: rhomboid family intramembrane serine protease [Pseudomonadota bacterium]
MDKPEHPGRGGWLALLKNLPDSVASIGIVLSSIYVATALAPDRVVLRAWRWFELTPARVLSAGERGDYVSFARAFLGHVFFHINLAHLLFNLAAIIVAGAFVHSEMSRHAAARKSDAAAAFLAFFMLSGMFAGLGYVAADATSFRSMIGASGAAAGLVGACVWIMTTRDENGAPTENPQRSALLIFAVSAVLISLSILLDTSKLSVLLFGSTTVWQAHIGGYLFGVVAYPFFERLAHAGK